MKSKTMAPYVRTVIIHMIFCIALVLTVPQNSSAFTTAPESFADIAEKLGPTVVNVYTTQVLKSSRVPQIFPFQEDDEIPEMFKRFFGFPHPNGRTPRREMKRTSLGSGVIHTSDGYIITNNHVVENADKINIRLTNHEEYEAKIIGRDPKTDLALIKIEPKSPLPTANFGNSEKLRVGDWVVAIGNPFGFEQTVTAGIVSGKGRSIGTGPYENFIQTDASINPGNSGGPLFNLKGEMVGINSAIYSRSGGNIGLGFAIPINMAKTVIQQLKEHGKVTRGWLGVMIQHVSPELADQFKLERPTGALVGEVTPESPAEKAGIKPGDIILTYDGKEINQMTMLPSLVAQTTVGNKVEITLFRNGKKENITITIGKLKEDQPVYGALEDKVDKELGLTLQTLTPELAESLQIKEKTGLVITDVEPGSSAAEVGLKRGDLVLEVNRKPVDDVKTYHQILKKVEKNGKILFLIKRDEHTRFVVLKKQ